MSDIVYCQEFVELILTIPQSDEGRHALDELSGSGKRFEIEYIQSLSDKLKGLEAGAFLAEQSYTYHLVRTPSGIEGRAIRGIVQWFDGESGRGRVESVELNSTLLLSAAPLGLPFTLGGFHQAYLQQMNVPAAWNQARRNDPVRVAILDSGADAGAGIRMNDFYDVEPPGICIHPVPPAPYDHDGHGTAMSTLIQEVAPQAELYVVRVLDVAGIRLWNLIAGAGVAIVDCKADIVNMSLGIDKFLPKCGICGAPAPVRQLAFERLVSTAAPGRERPIGVASTGNGRSTTSFDFPASTDKCLAMGAVDSSDRRTTVSNYGGTNPSYAMAPGGKEDPPLSLQISEEVGRGGANANPCFATSVSTAYATGMLALLRGMQAYDHLSNGMLVDELLQNHCNMPPNGTPAEYGRGVIRFAANGPGGQPPQGPGIHFTEEPVFLGQVRVPRRRR